MPVAADAIMHALLSLDVWISFLRPRTHDLCK